MATTPIDVLILRALFAAGGEYVSGVELAKEAGVSRAAIWKHLDQLQQVGYAIDAQPHHGYRLAESLPDVWCADEITARLDEGCSVHWRPLLFAETASTNDIAMREAIAGTPEGLVVLADRQTRGRGRQGRVWESPAGLGLTCSLVVRPQWPVSQMTRLTILTSVALAEAVEELAGVRVRIKWPNDLFIGDRKLGGILCEAHADPERLRFAVIGFGLDVNHAPDDFSPEVRALATSLRMETGRTFRRADVLLSVVAAFERHLRGDFAVTRELWRERCFTLGRQITVSTPHGERHGTAVALDDNGALLLRHDNGDVEAVTAGDIL